MPTDFVSLNLQAVRTFAAANGFAEITDPDHLFDVGCEGGDLFVRPDNAAIMFDAEGNTGAEHPANGDVDDRSSDDMARMTPEMVTDWLSEFFAA